MALTVVAKTKNEFAQKEISIESNISVLTANWLKSDYKENLWVIADTRSSSPKRMHKIRFDVIVFDPRRTGETCCLTDPEYQNMLKTIKAQIFGLRTGRFATVTAAKVHDHMASAIINWASWMILNNIRCFSHLTPQDFEVYRESALYGPGQLLQYAKRLTECVENLRAANLEIPSCVTSNARPRLDATKLLTIANIDAPHGWRDKTTSYELLKIAHEENFYLTPKQRERLLAGPPKLEKVVNIPLLRMLQPWDYQWRMRNTLHPGNCVQFNAFEDTSPDRVAYDLGVAIGRTETPPVRQTMEIIDRSLRWVLDYAPILLELRNQFDELLAENFSKETRNNRMKKIVAKFELPVGPGSPNPLDAGTKKIANGISFGTALLEFLPAACFIVIAAFTARRLYEVLSVRAAGPNNDDCISSDANGYYLETYTEKTVRDWERLPCTEVVAAAIEVLRKWSEPARKFSGDVKLFRYKALIAPEAPLFNLKGSLRNFVRFQSLAPTENGDAWEFKPHQFRRFFAIMYFWRYEYGDLSALSQHLRHFNTEMTQIYVTESETGAIFKHAGLEFTTTILAEAAQGKRNVSGPFGERFKEKISRLVQQYRRRTKIVTPNLINETVEKYVEKSSRRLKGFRWGYCACGTAPQQLSAARCLQGSAQSNTAVEPDLSKSSPTICGDCPHHLTGEVFKDFWKQELEMHEQAAQDPKNGALLREASRQRAATLKRQYDRSFVNSKPVEKIND